MSPRSRRSACASGSGSARRPSTRTSAGTPSGAPCSSVSGPRRCGSSATPWSATTERVRIRGRSRLLTAAVWPVGIALTSWSYLWRTTPMHRRELPGDDVADRPAPLPDAAGEHDLQPPARGVGPLFHRRYRIRIRDAHVGPEVLLRRLTGDLNSVAPRTFARFVKVRGDDEALAVGDELVVRMPGPWDGPVRVVDVGPRSFRLATLEGHLEAGQIEFRAYQDEQLV